jgi:hypothetical protein
MFYNDKHEPLFPMDFKNLGILNIFLSVDIQYWQKVIRITKNAINEKPVIEITLNFIDLLSNEVILSV